MKVRVAGRRPALALATVAVLGAATGCGGGGDTASGGAAADVNIGLIEPLSGPFADNGNMARLGAELCVEQINDAGGIKALDGAQLKLVQQDTGAAAPAQVANQLQSLIQQNELSAVIGAWASSYTLAASTVAEQSKVPMVTESFADDITSRGYKFIFQIPAQAKLMGQAPVDSVLGLAKTAGLNITRAAIVADNTSAAQVSAEGAAGRFQAAGIDVAVKEYFTPGLTDATSLALKVLAGDPQIIFLQGALSDMALLQNAFEQQGYAGPLVGAGSGFVVTNYAETVGAAANGSFSAAGWNWDRPGGAAEEFAKAFTEANPDFTFPGQEAGEDCSAVYIIAEALEKAGSAEPQAVRDAIAKVNITEGPATMLSAGKVSFDETGLLEGATPFIVQWQDGKPYTVAPEELATRKPIALTQG
jgi:branched-chain amino acid transport system substrate-binding protein